MFDKNKNELQLGDIVIARIFDMQYGAKDEIGSIVAFRGFEHVEVKIRHGRPENYVFLCNTLKKVPQEEAMLYLLQDTEHDRQFSKG